MTETAFDLARLKREGGLSHAEHHGSLTSTNDRGRELAKDLSPAGAALVLADEQTAGRGRGANKWWTGAGSLAFSLVFDPAARGIRREHFPLISLAAAIALAESADALSPNRGLGIHWPNDVFAGDRKLAGILVEALPGGMHIVGIGLNVNNRSVEAPDEIRARTTTLADLTGNAHNRGEVLISVLARLWPNLQQLAESAANLARRANRLCLQHGRHLTIKSGDRQAAGACIGIADDGALVLETDRGAERFYSGVLIH